MSMIYMCIFNSKIKLKILTLFFNSTLAKYLAPSSPIWLSQRKSVVRVFENKNQSAVNVEQKKNTTYYLHCFF